uniref:Ras-GEF domain-containing protein n=1 Tax=Gongylonema pulchrum TaxID=637853 RepID=A0A183EX70_9BILA
LKKTDSTPLEAAREWEMEMEREELEELASVLKSTNCSDVFEMDVTKIMRTLITVPNEGLMYENPKIKIKELSQRFAHFNYTYQYITKLSVKPDCTEQIPGRYIPHVVSLEQYGVDVEGSVMGDGAAPRFLLFIAKVSSSYLRLLNISTPYVS